MPSFLTKGFPAVVGTNTGHWSGIPFVESLGYDHIRQSQWRTEAYRLRLPGNHEVVNLAKKIINSYKGNNPKYSYWSGCSNGGREGLVEAQRYPDDFDGYVIGAPPYDITQAMIGYIYKGAVYQAVPNSKLCLQAKYVYNKCDSLDGLTDGLIDNPLVCDFDPMKDLPACPNEVDDPGCWTTAQREAIKSLYTGLHTSWGQSLDVGVPPGTEVCTDPTKPNTSGWYAFATANPLGQLVTKYLVMRDPGFDTANFNFDTDTFAVLARDERQWLCANSTDLFRVKNRVRSSPIMDGLKEPSHHWPLSIMRRW